MPRLRLRELCGYRAGDKGDIANVAIFADDDETYALITREVTAERVKAHFGAMVLGRPAGDIEPRGDRLGRETPPTRSAKKSGLLFRPDQAEEPPCSRTSPAPSSASSGAAPYSASM